MKVIISDTYEEMSALAAGYIANRINGHGGDGPFVLGLPTGSTPIGTYRKLAEMNREGKVSFKNVVTFNMDEYVGIPKWHEQSYRRFMHDNFFDFIDIDPKNIHMLDGNAEDLEKECLDYEETLSSYGYADLFLGGLGNDGHIAFNEPYSSFDSRTGIRELLEDTIIANSRFFGGDPALVPKTALSVGIRTITDSKEVLILAGGLKKSAAVFHMVEGPVTEEWPCSVLQLKKETILLCDSEAASGLT